MKILKIELQNLNSLKSDAPITIDFEDERFKDVGLFAITGSTGAGKTTILDAITIALYHNVPRFNDSKGTLRDVVSHGAHEAMSRITFRNEKQTYEAAWYMRLCSKSGKPLKNPQEEVSLKNLTTDAILSSQKRAVIDDIIAVTHLDYNQFLRSVMLAQGEFASFLTAKGKEKGRLLEQITGEQIYKKIGQGILDRRSLEERKLNEIRSKINAEDLLGDEEKLEITQQNTALDGEIAALQKQLKEAQEIDAWFKKFNELHLESETLSQQENHLKQRLKENAGDFSRLKKHEQATPFGNSIQQLTLHETQLKERTEELAKTDKELVALTPTIEKIALISKKQQEDLAIAKKEYDHWQPKFEKIITLDNKMVNIIGEQEKITTKGSQVKKELTKLKETLSETTDKLHQMRSEIKTSTETLTHKKFMIQVNEQLTSWNTDFTNLTSYHRQCDSDKNTLQHKLKDGLQIEDDLNKNSLILEQAQKKVATVKDKVTAIDNQLAHVPLADLIDHQKTLSSQVSDWKDFKTLSYDYKVNVQEQKQNKMLLSSYLNDLEDLKREQTSLQSRIKIQEAQVKDAQRILDLEKSLAKYEEDRKHLIDGEPCGLCGSTAHPYATHVDQLGVSESTAELEKRIKELENDKEVKSTLDKKEVQLRTSLENVNQQIGKAKKQQEITQEKADSLNLTTNLADQETIEQQLSKSTASLNTIEEKIKTAQQLQSAKKELLDFISKDEELIISLKAKEATLKEKQKNNKSDISDKTKTVEQLNLQISELSETLKEKLAVFDYDLPPVDQIDIFIKDIEKDIKQFNQAEKDLESLKSKEKVTLIQIENNERLISTLEKDREKLLADYKEAASQLQKLKSHRIALLPEHLTVENKRNALNQEIKTYTDQADATLKNLQQAKDKKRDLETLKQSHLKEQSRLQNVLQQLQQKFEKELIQSPFSNRESIKSALLAPAELDQISQLKKQLQNEELQLNALLLKNKEAKTKVAQSKDFEITQEENHSRLIDLNEKKDTKQAAKGEFKEILRKDQEIRDRNREVYKKIDAQEKVYQTWKELFKIIGNSKDAFNDYVQRLTLKHLLDLANVHLFQLNKRYSLKMEEEYRLKEELNFHLIDHYQTDQVRLVDTSSGGEKFLISLALALGLSDLASKNVRIDSLFIDEGFGTLDKNTLETVISTLETLKSQGKMIGIISHVENLKERIPTQIQITKKSNGVSRVELT